MVFSLSGLKKIIPLVVCFIVLLIHGLMIAQNYNKMKFNQINIGHMIILKH